MNWRKRVLEFGLALVIFLLFMNLIPLWQDYKNTALPVSAWFEVHDIVVPNHAQASNPSVVYDRTIHEAINGAWTVEVQENKEGFPNVCQGSGRSTYSPDSQLPDPLTWAWMIGKSCAVPPGIYRWEVSYTFSRDSYPDKSAVFYSNFFEVSPSQ